MLASIRLKLSDVQFTNPIHQRQAVAVQVMMLVTAVAALAGAFLFIAAPMAALPRLLSLSATLLLLLGALFSLLWVRHGNFTGGVTLIVGSTLLAVMLVLVGTGLGNAQAILFVLAPPITFAGLLGTRRLMLTTAASELVIILLVFLIDSHFQAYTHSTPASDPLTTIGIFLIALLVLTSFTENFATTIKRTLRESLEREQELQQLRASLEQSVNQRTEALQQALADGEIREAVLARALNNLHESEERQRAILNAIPDAIYRVDARGVCVDYKPEKDAPLVFDPSEIIGKHTYSIMPPDLASQLRHYGQKVLETGQLHVFEFTLVHDGKPRDRESRMVACGNGEVLSIVRDITERRRNERLKNEFVALVSHELRTPLTSIGGALGLVMNGVTGPITPAAHDMLQVAMNNSQRLLRLINDILDVERLERGMLTFDLQPLALRPLVEQAIVANEGYASQYQVALQFHSPFEDATILANGDRIQQVMANLLSNAIKFSPTDATVQVSLTRLGQQARVAVSDSGPGISNHFQPHVFEKFAQADSSDQRQNGGAGLGLSISKAIIERCGGTIGFFSNPERGTTFYFDLPILESE